MLAFLVMLPVAVIGTIYMNRDYLSWDGVALIYQHLRQKAYGRLEAPDEWGHATIPAQDTTIPQIANLVRAGDHAALDALAAQDPKAFDAFQDTSPDLADALDAWIAARPGSALAHGMRGRYWLQVGFHLRGGGFANRTSRVQFAGLRQAHAQAEADHVRAITLDPGFALAYRDLISIYGMSRRDDAQWAVWERAVSQGVADARLHRTLFQMLTPWWSQFSRGESIRAVRKIIDEIERGSLPGSDEIDVLNAYPAFIHAESEWRRGNRLKALRLYEEFIDGPGASYLLDDYARRLNSFGRGPEALGYFVRSLRFDPNNAPILNDYVRLLRVLDREDEAREMIARSLALDPYDPETLTEAAQLHLRRDEFDEARALIERAKVYGAERGSVQRLDVMSLFNATESLPEAAAQHRAAIAAEPEKPWNYFVLGITQDRMHDCAAIPTYLQFIERCAGGRLCNSNALTWTKVRYQSLVDRGIRSLDGVHTRPDVWLPMGEN